MATTRRESSTEYVLEHFTIQESENGGVSCNLCDFVCEAVISVQLAHLKTKHGYNVIEETIRSIHDTDDHDESMEDSLQKDTTSEPVATKTRRTTASVWCFFQKSKLLPGRATCNFCKRSFSYKTTITNLTKHLLRSHSVEKFDAAKKVGTGTSSPAMVAVISEGPRKASNVWKYYEVTDKEQRLATCLMCGQERSYRSTITNLKKHVEARHVINGEIDPAFLRKLEMRAATKKEIEIPESGGETETEDNDTLSHVEIDDQGEVSDKSRNLSESSTLTSSVTWLYYKKVDETLQMAECNICKERFSYMFTLINLKKHLLKEHADVEIPQKDDGSKRTLLSSNGKLFEINVQAHGDDEQNNQDPIETDTLYLEDFDASCEEVEEPAKKKIKTKSEKLTDNENDSSSDDGMPLKNDSLDHFGKYLVSLLRQLPTKVSNKLQADFIRQIMHSQR